MVTNMVTKRAEKNPSFVKRDCCHYPQQNLSVVTKIYTDYTDIKQYYGYQLAEYLYLLNRSYLWISFYLNFKIGIEVMLRLRRHLQIVAALRYFNTDNKVIVGMLDDQVKRITDILTMDGKEKS